MAALAMHCMHTRRLLLYSAAASRCSLAELMAGSFLCGAANVLLWLQQQWWCRLKRCIIASMVLRCSLPLPLLLLLHFESL